MDPPRAPAPPAPPVLPFDAFASKLLEDAEPGRLLSPPGPLPLPLGCRSRVGGRSPDAPGAPAAAAALDDPVADGAVPAIAVLAEDPPDAKPATPTVPAPAPAPRLRRDPAAPAADDVLPAPRLVPPCALAEEVDEDEDDALEAPAAVALFAAPLATPTAALYISFHRASACTGSSFSDLVSMKKGSTLSSRANKASTSSAWEKECSQCPTRMGLIKVGCKALAP